MELEEMEELEKLKNKFEQEVKAMRNSCKWKIDYETAYMKGYEDCYENFIGILENKEKII